MQPDPWNGVGGDVVLDSINNASRNEDSILDQIYASKYARIFTFKILNLNNNSFKIITCHIFGIKCCLLPYMPC